jgi:hypothetical protein
MNESIIVNYRHKSKENLNRTLIRRRYGETINQAIKENKDASVILLETPADNYLDVNLASVQTLLKTGYEGVYLSFQRPYNNIIKMLRQQKIDTDKILVIDEASAIAGDIFKEKSSNIQIPRDIENIHITNTICSYLQKLKSNNRFVFVDSLTTLALYKSRSKAYSLPQCIINRMKKDKIDDVVLFINIAQDIIQDKYFDRLSFYSDEHIHLGICT